MMVHKAFGSSRHYNPILFNNRFIDFWKLARRIDCWYAETRSFRTPRGRVKFFIWFGCQTSIRCDRPLPEVPA